MQPWLVVLFSVLSLPRVHLLDLDLVLRPDRVNRRHPFPRLPLSQQFLAVQFRLALQLFPLDRLRPHTHPRRHNLTRFHATSPHPYMFLMKSGTSLMAKSDIDPLLPKQFTLALLFFRVWLDVTISSFLWFIRSTSLSSTLYLNLLLTLPSGLVVPSLARISLDFMIGLWCPTYLRVF